MKTALAKPWQVALALTLVYLCWGTTYMAIEVGVRELPPGLFGGIRLFLAGLVVLAFWKLTGQSILLSLPNLFWLWVTGSFLFVGGNGLITLAEKTVPSGLASVLVATTPLWLALVEATFPGRDRPSLKSWVGLLCGLAGVVVLMSTRLMEAAQHTIDWQGPLLTLGSALSWAIGSAIHRRHHAHTSPVCMAAWQMALGGATLAIIGLAAGELRTVLDLPSFPTKGVLALLYLLVVGSLIGFVAYIWLLTHVSSALAGTYAYVNPVVALIIGWLLAGEKVTLPVLVGMAIILSGVALVRSDHAAHLPPRSSGDPEPLPSEEMDEELVPLGPPGD